MPAVGITDGPLPCARDHRAVVLSCPHLARRWAVLDRRSAWLVVNTQVKACSRETHSLSRASKIYGHEAFQKIGRATLLNTSRTVGVRCGCFSAECPTILADAAVTPTVSEMTYNVLSGTLNNTQPSSTLTRRISASLLISLSQVTEPTGESHR